MRNWTTCLGVVVLASTAFGPVASSTAASAQPDARFKLENPVAVVGAMQIAQRRRLSADEIRKRLVGRTIRRDGQIQSRRGGTIRGAVYLLVRPDGSILYKCEWYSERQDAWAPCRGLKDGYLRDGFTNGVWAIKNDTYCLRASTFNFEVCYAVYDDGRLFFQARGKRIGAFTGYVEFLDETRLACIGYLKSGNC